MGQQRYPNNFNSTFVAAVLAAPVTGTPATELGYGILQLNGAASAWLSPLAAGDWYVITAFKRLGSVESSIEIMKVTAVDTGTPGECRITVNRAQEGSAASTFIAGDYVAIRWTKGSAETLGAHMIDAANPHAVTKAQVGLSNADNTSDANKPVSTAQAAALALKVDLTAMDTDTALAANSDARLATQKAVKAYIDALLAAQDVLVFKGGIDCSANPNFPAASAGHFYKISVAGKIGGAAGINVESGDSIYCTVDGSAAGTSGAVGVNWVIMQVNLDGAVIGPAASTDNHVAMFNGATGKLIKDSGLTLAGSNTGDETGASIATLAHAASNKTTPVDNDEFSGTDSAAGFGLIRVTWANIKAGIWTALGALIAAGTNKATIVAGDLLAIADSAAANATKYVSFTNVAAFFASLTQTLTNKRVSPRVGTSAANSATPAINTDNVDIFRITGQSIAITSMTTGLTGAPTDSQPLIIEITGTGAIGITWGASFEASTIALPTATVGTNKLSCGFLYNSVTSKWRIVGSC